MREALKSNILELLPELKKALGKVKFADNLDYDQFNVEGNKIYLSKDLKEQDKCVVLAVDKDKGLSSLLLEDVKKYSKYICKTEIENLDVIPSGIVPPNPSELLGSEKTKEFLELLKEKYDLIIIDCPPINAVTDALVLTKFADEVVLVSAYKLTPIDLLEQSKKALENSGAKIAGVIVNKLENKKDHYYYGKYYN